MMNLNRVLVFSDNSSPRRSHPRLPVARPEQLRPIAHPSTPGKKAPPREFMHVRKVASVLDVTPKRIYRLIDSGELEAIRLGPRQTRVLKASVESYIDRLLREEAEREI